MDDARPTLLLIGTGEPLDDAVRRYLKQYRVVAESSSVADAVLAVTASAPDLVVLWGDAAKDGGAKVLEALAGSPITSLAPVALLLDDASLDDRLRAFRSGAVAVIPRSASADAIAKRISELIRELPTRLGEATGALGEATLEELVQLVSRKLRSGIVSVEGAGDQTPIRLMLGTGTGVAKALDAFVEQLAPLVADAQPLRYELFETAGGRLQLGDEELDSSSSDLSVFRELRVLIMEDDPARADGFAQSLRDRGAQVAVTDFGARGLERARKLDPAIVVLDAGAIEGAGFDTVRRIRRDTRLRWASLLVARWEELWPQGSAAPDLERVAARVAPLVLPDQELVERANADEPFDTRLELTGPSRLIRALARVEGTRRVSARAAGTSVDVDIADGLVVGAKGTHGGIPVEGSDALTALLALAAARVHVERRAHAEAANVMLPVDEALDGALAQMPEDLVSGSPPPLVAKESGRPAADSPADPSQAPALDPATLKPRPKPMVHSSGRGSSTAAPPPDYTGVADATDTTASTVAPPADYDSSKAAAERSAPPKPKPKKSSLKSRTMLGVGIADVSKPSKSPTPKAPSARPKPGRKLAQKTMLGVGIDSKDLVSKEKDVLDLETPAAPPAAELSPALGEDDDDVTLVVPSPPDGTAPKPPSAPPADLGIAKTMMAMPSPTQPGGDFEGETTEVDSSRKKPTSDPAKVSKAKTMFGLGGIAAPPAKEDAAEEPLDLDFGSLDDGSVALNDDAFADPEASGSVALPSGDYLMDPFSEGELPLPDDETDEAPSSPNDPPRLDASSYFSQRDEPTDPPPALHRASPWRWLAPLLILLAAAGAYGAYVAIKGQSGPDQTAGVDSEAVDSGAVDSGAVDSGAVDSGAVLAALADTGTPDAEPAVDANVETAPDAQTETPTDDPETPTDDSETPDADADEFDQMSARERDRIADRLARDASRAIRDGALAQGRAMADRALRADERNPHAIAARAEFHIASGQGAQAVEWAQRAISRRGRRAAYRVLLGDAHRANGDRAAAQTAWLEALELEPDNRRARARLGRD